MGRGSGDREATAGEICSADKRYVGRSCPAPCPHVQNPCLGPDVLELHIQSVRECSSQGCSWNRSPEREASHPRSHSTPVVGLDTGQEPRLRARGFLLPPPPHRPCGTLLLRAPGGKEYEGPFPLVKTEAEGTMPRQSLPSPPGLNPQTAPTYPASCRVHAAPGWTHHVILGPSTKWKFRTFMFKIKNFKAVAAEH